MRPGILKQENIELIKVMSNTFWKDKMCRDIALTKDIRREHAFYRSNRFGIGAKCKADEESKSMQVCLELKGLSVTTDKGFNDAIMHHDYDQAAAWYLNVMTGSTFYKYQLIVGISKKQPDRLFKLLVDRDHAVYKSGLQKVRKAVNIWKIYGFN